MFSVDQNGYPIFTQEELDNCVISKGKYKEKRLVDCTGKQIKQIAKDTACPERFQARYLAVQKGLGTNEEYYRYSREYPIDVHTAEKKIEQERIKAERKEQQEEYRKAHPDWKREEKLRKLVKGWQKQVEINYEAWLEKKKQEQKQEEIEKEHEERRKKRREYELQQNVKFRQNLLNAEPTELSELLSSTHAVNTAIETMDDKPCLLVLYISDIHIGFHIKHDETGHYNDNDQGTYHSVQELAYTLANSARDRIIEVSQRFRNHKFKPMIVFCGDTADYLEVQIKFYSDFMQKLMRDLEAQEVQRCDNLLIDPNSCFVFAVNGNHESGLASFYYSGMFDDPCPPKEEYHRRRDEYFSEQVRRMHNLGIELLEDSSWKMPVGYHDDVIIYGAEEINHTSENYQKALQVARLTGYKLICLSHYPIYDIPTPDSRAHHDQIHVFDPDPDAVYFSGHSHQNTVKVTDTTQIYADNQVGYYTRGARFKYYMSGAPINPFSKICDGMHQISLIEYEQYLKINDEYSSTVNLAKYTGNGAKLMMIRWQGYACFLLAKKDEAENEIWYICSGGSIKTVGKNIDKQYFIDNFPDMIAKCLGFINPYYDYMKQVAEEVCKITGNAFSPWIIHGCIIDIDGFNHIMVNPNDHTFTYYYSPVMGVVERFASAKDLIAENVTMVAQNRYTYHLDDVQQKYHYNEYQKMLDNYNLLEFRHELQYVDQQLPAQVNSSTGEIGKLEKIQIKGSMYGISAVMKQYQRLTGNKILRRWDDALLPKNQRLDAYQYTLPDKSTCKQINDSSN